MSAKFHKNGVINCTPIDGFDKVSIMKNDIIVGENLLKDTYTFKDWVPCNSAVSLIPNCYNGAAATFSTSAWSYYLKNCAFEAGKTYTISAKVKCEVGEYVAFFTFNGGGQDFIILQQMIGRTIPIHLLYQKVELEAYGLKTLVLQMDYMSHL